MLRHLYLLAYVVAMEVSSDRVRTENFAVLSQEKQDRAMDEVKRQLAAQECADTNPNTRRPDQYKTRDIPENFLTNVSLHEDALASLVFGMER